MKKNLILSLVFAFALVGVAVPASVSAVHENQGLAEHCPDHNGHPGKVQSGESPKTINVDGVNVTVTINGKNVAFTDSNGDPIVVEFCMKASDLAGGKQTGSSGTVTWVNHGGQVPNISYVVVYSVVDDEEPETPVVPEVPAGPQSLIGDEVVADEAQVDAPGSGVKAGAGSLTTVLPAVLTFLGSIGSLAYGLVRFGKFGV